MKKRSSGLLNRWRKARPLFAKAGTVGGFVSTLLFALYNGGLGLWYASLWYGSICAYYNPAVPASGHFVGCGALPQKGFLCDLRDRAGHERGTAHLSLPDGTGSAAHSNGTDARNRFGVVHDIQNRHGGENCRAFHFALDNQFCQ